MLRAEVIDDWEQHAEHEDKRHNRFFQAEEQNQQRSAHSAKDIQGHFFIDEALGIFQNSRHTTDEAIFIKMFLICFCAFIVLASALGASN